MYKIRCPTTATHQATRIIRVRVCVINIYTGILTPRTLRALPVDERVVVRGILYDTVVVLWYACMIRST